MAAQTRTRTDRVILSRCKNRPYLASCPVDIISAVFFADAKTQKKAMQLCLRSRTERAVSALSFYAVYLDREGKKISEAMLTFSGIYLTPGKTAVSSKKVILPYQDIAGVRAYIISVTYDNGEVQEFEAGDYVLTPEQALLEGRHSESDCRLLRRHLGDSCFFVPKIGTPEWFCSCGAAASGEVCSACGMKKKTAAVLTDPKKTASLIRSHQAGGAVLKVIPYAAAFLLFCGGVLVLRNVAAEYLQIRLPEQRLAVTRRFIEEHRYEEALGYSVSKNHSLLYGEILDAAVEYCCQNGEYERAVSFERCRETPDYEPIYESAARAFAETGDETAAFYGLSVADDALRNGVLRRLSEDMLAKNRRTEACTYALAMRGEEGQKYADGILYDTIAVLLEDSQYENAVACIGYLRDKTGVPALCRGIEQELLSRGRYDEAFTVASITGDQSVFALAYPTAGTSTIRRYYDKFFAFMTAGDKREFLASSLDAGGSLVCIRPNGEALDSALGVLCENAISTAAGSAHVLVLQKDGTVRAFGDNSYGQCGCDGMTGAIAVAAGENHSLVLLENGTVRAFGDDGAGQCDVGEWTGVISIAAGARHSVGVCTDGRVVSAGSSSSGQRDVLAYENVVSVAAGDYSTILIFRDGTVAVTGNIAVETFAARTWEDVVRVAAGNGHLIALTSGGRILTAGDPGYTGTEAAADWSRVRMIACGAQSVYAMDAYGKILTCGSDVPSLSGSGWESLIQ